jgi:hypothetical protein
MMQPTWITSVLRAAGLYNLLWGTLVVLFPLAAFDWAGMPPPNYPELWQCIGMIVGVYGIGYWIAAHDVARHWPIVLVGLLGKIFGPIGMAAAIYRGALPPAAGWVSLFNDLIWWWPFCAALWHAFKVNSAPTAGSEHANTKALQSVLSQHGRSLVQLSMQRPVLVTFLRHSGCTFCREALADLSSARKAIAGTGLQLALVHMSSEQDGATLAAHYQLADVERFSDPQQLLYRAFELNRGRFHQLLGPAIWWRGFLAAIVARHGFNRIDGDGFQMPGVFVLDRGQIVASYRHQTAADRPDYAEIATQACEVR